MRPQNESSAQELQANSPENAENLLHSCDTDNKDRLKKKSRISEKCYIFVY